MMTNLEKVMMKIERVRRMQSVDLYMMASCCRIVSLNHFFSRQQDSYRGNDDENDDFALTVLVMVCVVT